MLNSGFIKNIAREAGFDLCGIARVRNLSAERDFFEDWLLRGFGGSLDYLRHNADKRFSPEQLMEGAQSVVVCGVSYKNELSCGYGSTEKYHKIASYALSEDYHVTIKNMLGRMAAGLKEEYGDFGWRAFVDTAPIHEKLWAAEAGLGFIGRNSLLVSPSHGSFVLLGILLVDRKADAYDERYTGPGCGECRRCMERCPNGALTCEGINVGRCIARLTVEKEMEAPDPDITLDGWVFACDECQSVCPYNRDAPEYANPAFTPVADPRDLDTEWWLSLTEEEFVRKFGNTPMSRAGLERIRANVVLGAQGRE